MKKNNDEIIRRINRCYVGDDCVQLMVPYKNGITILNKNGILYHHKKDSDLFIYKYADDERRKQFPYSSIPMHSSRKINGKYQFANQLFNYNEPYIRINDGSLIESYVVKDNNDALIVSKLLPYEVTTSFKTRKEVEELLNPHANDNEKIYSILVDGGIIEYNLPTEKDIELFLKEYLNKEINDYLDFKNDEIGGQFIKYNVDKLNLDDYKMNLNLTENGTILIAKADGKEIHLKGFDIYYVTSDLYKVDSYDISVTEYTLEQLKYLSPKIKKTKEPKISLLCNPNITKQQLRVEKAKVKTLGTKSKNNK